MNCLTRMRTLFVVHRLRLITDLRLAHNKLQSQTSSIERYLKSDEKGQKRITYYPRT